MQLTEWIREKLEQNGKGWVVNNYLTACREIGRDIPYGSFSRSIRHVMAERAAQGKTTEYGESLESHDVDTEEKAELYHDVDHGSWEPEKLRVNTWGSPTNQNRQVRIEYGKRKHPTPQEFADHFAKQVEAHAPRYPKLRRPETYSGVIAEANLPDHHMGRESWESAEEAQTVFLDALGYLVRPYKRGEFDRILLPVGNDYLNWDNWIKTTTAGTPQPGGERPDHVIGIGVDTLVAGIDMLTRIADVDVVVVPGNHDWLLSHMVGRYLEAWYRNAPHVTVDATLEDWKFRAVGDWLIALTHGKHPDNKRAYSPEELATALPLKAPHLWAQAKYREVQTGHLHHKSKGFDERVKETDGVVVRRLSSLARRNEHEKAHLYNSGREAELIVFDHGGPYEFRNYRVPR